MPIKIRVSEEWDILGSGGGAGGSDKDIQFNDSGALNGSENFTWNNTTNLLNINGKISINASGAFGVGASPDYGAIGNELEKQNINKPTIKDVSNAVISIRSSKLPDPKKIGNSGSFFKNPIISKTKLTILKQNFPEIPSYNISDKLVKIPAGWLIEHVGFKGKTFNNYGVHKNQALVLVNYGNASGKDILNLSKLIQKTIKRIFDINLEAEVNII